MWIYQILKRHKLLQFARRETENLSWLISIERSWINNKLPKKKAPDSDGFTGEFHQIKKLYQFPKISCRKQKQSYKRVCAWYLCMNVHNMYFSKVTAPHKSKPYRKPWTLVNDNVPRLVCSSCQTCPQRM